MFSEEAKLVKEIARNMKDFDRKFLLHLHGQKFPQRPYDFNAPYKKIRYVLYKYIEMGILKLNNWGWECEITVHFTSVGYYLMDYIEKDGD